MREAYSGHNHQLLLLVTSLILTALYNVGPCGLQEGVSGSRDPPSAFDFISSIDVPELLRWGKSVVYMKDQRERQHLFLTNARVQCFRVALRPSRLSNSVWGASDPEAFTGPTYWP